MEENENNEVERDVEVLEFAIDSEEIEELTNKLKTLKENKQTFNFLIDEEHELVFHYDEGEEDDE